MSLSTALNRLRRPAGWLTLLGCLLCAVPAWAQMGNSRRPPILIDEALALAQRFLQQGGLSTAGRHIDSAQLESRVGGDFRWVIRYQPDQWTKGGDWRLEIDMQGQVILIRGK